MLRMYAVLFLILVVAISAKDKDEELQRLRQKDDLTIEEFRRLFYLEHDKDLYEIDGYKYYKRYYHFWGNRLKAGKPDPVALFNEYNSPKKLKEQKGLQAAQPRWEEVGPFTPPSGANGLGRVNVIRVHPRKPGSIFAGASGGGIWRSSDYGVTWEILPGTDFLSMTISDIAISPTDPNTIYAATGDANSHFVVADTYSVGVIKSTDGGDTWELTNLVYEFRDETLVGRVLVHPQNKNIVIAATSRGIERSEDGGETWTRTQSGHYFKDLEFHPTDPDIIYASTMGRNVSITVFKSEDNGITWTAKRSFDNAIRCEMTVSKENPDIVYAMGVQGGSTEFPERSGAIHSVLLSEDKGETWDIVTSFDENPDLLGSSPQNSTRHQGYYDACIAANPDNFEDLIIGGVRIWLSNDAGEDWTYSEDFNRRNDNPLSMHVDHHFAEYTSTGDSIWLGNDGGVWLLDLTDNKYYFRSEGMNITEFYRMDISQQDEGMITSGCQDNSSFLLQNGAWDEVLGGDGMDNAINPNDDDYVYVSSQNGNFRYSTNRGNNFSNMINSNMIRNIYGENESGAWVTPVAVDPVNSKNIYVGYNNIWRNLDHGDPASWQKVTDHGWEAEYEFIKVAEGRPQTVYAGYSGYLSVSYNSGGSWQQIQTPFSFVSNIAIDSKDDRHFYTTYTGYDPNQKVYEYENGVWKNITGNLPNVPVNCIVIDKLHNDRIYIGTDIGVFYSDHSSGIWIEFGQDMPHTVINDLVIQEEESKLYAATYGRGVWSSALLGCETAKIDIELSEPVNEGKICKTDSIFISIVDPQPGLNYIWSNGEVGNRILANQSFDYSVTIESNEPCKPVSSLIHIDIIETDEVTITSRPNTNVVCPGDSIRLNPGLGFESFEWQDGSTDRYFYAKESGTYSVKAFNEFGCYSVGEFEVLDKPVINFLGGKLTISGGESYQWYFEGEIIEGATEDDFTPEETGNYQVEVTYDNCVILSESYYIEVSDIEDVFSEFNINPNPSSGRFTLTIPEDFKSEIKISIHDIQGRVIIEKIAGPFTKKLDFDLSGQNNGVYFINLTNGSRSGIKKIVVNK